jgi:hypothetical protein
VILAVYKNCNRTSGHFWTKVEEMLYNRDILQWDKEFGLEFRSVLRFRIFNDYGILGHTLGSIHSDSDFLKKYTLWDSLCDLGNLGDGKCVTKFF